MSYLATFPVVMCVKYSDEYSALNGLNKPNFILFYFICVHCNALKSIGVHQNLSKPIRVQEIQDDSTRVHESPFQSIKVHNPTLKKANVKVNVLLILYSVRNSALDYLQKCKLIYVEKCFSVHVQTLLYPTPHKIQFIMNNDTTTTKRPSLYAPLQPPLFITVYSSASEITQGHLICCS